MNRFQFCRLFALYITFGFATLLLEVPLVALLERAICYRHFQVADSAREPLGEGACKVSEVQDVLSQMVGWKMFFDALPGM